MKGIIYIMTTAVSGLIKIGQTGTKRNLEFNLEILKKIANTLDTKVENLIK